MNYITTNIRIPEEDYTRLKKEAFEQKKSLAELIRQKITNSDKRKKDTKNSLLARMEDNARKMRELYGNFDSVKILREMRYGT